MLTDASPKSLEQERDETLAEIQRLQRFLEIDLDEADDEIDPNLAEREKTLALIQTLERRVEMLNRAVESAQKGKYGICEDCGQPIDAERLAILPETTLCVKCAQKRSKRRW